MQSRIPSLTPSKPPSKRRLNPEDFAFVSAVALISKSAADVRRVSHKANADLILAFSFAPGGKSCEIELVARTDVTRRITSILANLDLAHTNLEVRVASS